MGTIDHHRLDELELSLEEVTVLFREADLDGQYDSLVQSQRTQRYWVNNYQDQLSQLRIDVDNVQQINMTIPRTCFNRLNLEPTKPAI